MDDLISRQAAIDSIEKHLRFGDELYPLTDADKILNHGFEIAASCVYNLPSAQPVITCDGCKFVGTYDTDFPCCNCVRKEKDYYDPER